MPGEQIQLQNPLDTLKILSNGLIWMNLTEHASAVVHLVRLCPTRKQHDSRLTQLTLKAELSKGRCYRVTTLAWRHCSIGHRRLEDTYLNPKLPSSTLLQCVIFSTYVWCSNHPFAYSTKVWSTTERWYSWKDTWKRYAAGCTHTHLWLQTSKAPGTMMELMIEARSTPWFQEQANAICNGPQPEAQAPGRQ